ncbi:hypothetical protein NGC67_01850 [Mammaliicoccus fleurettii]|uniref:hypothetical protein n=1 Tax=Mammaliicoccus fleurettii TaxID=150056 RepID=UPI002DBA9892|nr:hypothetical protein [Mammaliicoccus fleurettii]MEB7805413.1 hypothetical protein [Mammaliicoccus fleurettii]
MKTIKLFNEGIFKKATAAKKVRIEHNNSVTELSGIDAKITHQRKEKNFAEVSRLKKRQNELEENAGSLDLQLQSNENNITDNEFKAFYDTYNGELNVLAAKHSKLNEQMLEKIEELKAIFAELDDVKHDAGRLISRKLYVDDVKQSPESFNRILEDTLPTHKIILSSNEDTNPRHYSWIVDKKLSDAVTENARKRYNNNGGTK